MRETGGGTGQASENRAKIWSHRPYVRVGGAHAAESGRWFGAETESRSLLWAHPPAKTPCRRRRYERRELQLKPLRSTGRASR